MLPTGVGTIYNIPILPILSNKYRDLILFDKIRGLFFAFFKKGRKDGIVRNEVILHKKKGYEREEDESRHEKKHFLCAKVMLLKCRSLPV